MAMKEGDTLILLCIALRGSALCKGWNPIVIFPIIIFGKAYALEKQDDVGDLTRALKCIKDVLVYSWTWTIEFLRRDRGSVVGSVKLEAAFFVPSTRMRDLVHDEDHLFPWDWEMEEVELRAGVNFMHSGFTFDDLWDLPSRKIVWMGVDTFAALIDDDIFNFCQLFDYETLFSVRPATSLDADGGDNDVEVCSCSLADTTTTIVDYALQLMPSSKPIWTHLRFNELPSTDALSRFFDNPCSSGATIQFEANRLS
jgi:hypothetical protein